MDGNWSAEQWVKEVYLEGQNFEGKIDGDVWQTIGARRNGFVTTEVEADDNYLSITSEGDHNARYLAGLVFINAYLPFMRQQSI